MENSVISINVVDDMHYNYVILNSGKLMMTYTKIQTQQEIDSVFEKFYWEHAFIREVYVLNPSHYLNDKWLCNPDTLPNLGMVILTCDEDYPGLELVFTEVESMNMNFTCGINLKCQLVCTAN